MEADNLTKELFAGDPNIKLLTDDLGSNRSTIYPFDCPPLDIPFGGGIAAGRIYEFYGIFSSGKTTFALAISKIFADFMRKQKDDNYSILWIESESTFERERYHFMGCPPLKVALLETDVLELGHRTIKTYLRRCLQKKMRLLIVWDTIAATLTEKQKNVTDTIAKKSGEKAAKAAKKDILTKQNLVGESDEDNSSGDDEDDKKSKTNPGGMMEKPRLIRDMLKDITTELGATDSTLIILNQATTNPGRFQTTIESSGGHGLKHFASVRGFMQSVDTYPFEDAEGNKKEMYVSRITFVKNKLTGLIKTTVNLIVDKEEGLNTLATRISFLKQEKILPSSIGGWTPLKFPTDYAKNPRSEFEWMELKYQSVKQLIDVIQRYPQCLEWLDYKIYLKFISGSSLMKIHNIKKVWEFEKKFWGQNITKLTEREAETIKFFNHGSVKPSDIIGFVPKITVQPKAIIAKLPEKKPVEKVEKKEVIS